MENKTNRFFCRKLQKNAESIVDFAQFKTDIFLKHKI